MAVVQRGERAALGVVLSVVAAAALMFPPPLCAQPPAFTSRAEAIKGLDDAEASQRALAVVWFAQNGGAADDKLLLPHLGDDDQLVRELSERGMWVLWGRSGDKAVDALMAKGAEQMQSGELTASITTYSEVIRRKPAFAEGWNKRATALFLAGDLKRSLADCDQVMKRNPYHFGALSGYGQIYFQMKQYDKAIEYWKRAMKVNPNLAGLAANIEIAEKLRAEARKHSV